MYRVLLLLLSMFLLAGPGWAQQNDEELQVAEEPEETPDEDDAPEFDETGLDDQGFEDLDDDFSPTEQIPTDQSIEFPTDI